MDIICLFHSSNKMNIAGLPAVFTKCKKEAFQTAAGSPCILLFDRETLDVDLIKKLKEVNFNCFVFLVFDGNTETLPVYSWQSAVDGVLSFKPEASTLRFENRASSAELLQDILSGEYINDLIYGHPQRLTSLRPLFKLMQIDIQPHIVLTVVYDNFWDICQKKDNAYRYRLKRTLLNGIRKIMRSRMQGVASSLIGTDKVIVLLDCAKRDSDDAEEYADSCAFKIQSSVQKSTGLSISIGVSQYCREHGQLWKAYEQSFRSLESSFQMGSGQILHYSGEDPSIVGAPEKIEQENIKKELFIAISSQNVENCIGALNNLMATLSVQNSSESYTKSVIVITLSEIARYCILIGLDSSEVSEKVVLIVNDIFKARTMNDIKREALSFLHDLMTRIKNSSVDISTLDIAKAYIQQYYAKPLSLKELSDLCGYSTAYFSRCFKEHFGVNFVQYLMHIRLENAKKLLAETELNIADICDKTGFQTPGYFSTVFKRVCGMTPQQFRITERIRHI